MFLWDLAAAIILPSNPWVDGVGGWGAWVKADRWESVHHCSQLIGRRSPWQAEVDQSSSGLSIFAETCGELSKSKKERSHLHFYLQSYHVPHAALFIYLELLVLNR